MSKLKHILLSIAIGGCGQAAPEVESTMSIGMQQEQHQVRQAGTEAEVTGDPESLIGENAASARYGRCAVDQMPRNESSLAATPFPEPDVNYRAPSGPPKPVRYEQGPGAAAAAEPLAD
jgi:hypothetical protein